MMKGFHFRFAVYSLMFVFIVVWAGKAESERTVVEMWKAHSGEVGDRFPGHVADAQYQEIGVFREYLITTERFGDIPVLTSGSLELGHPVTIKLHQTFDTTGRYTSIPFVVEE